MIYCIIGSVGFVNESQWDDYYHWTVGYFENIKYAEEYYSKLQDIVHKIISLSIANSNKPLSADDSVRLEGLVSKLMGLDTTIFSVYSDSGYIVSRLIDVERFEYKVMKVRHLG